MPTPDPHLITSTATDADAALRGDPASADALRVEVQGHLRLGEPEKAIAAVRRATAAGDTSPATRYLMATAMYEAGHLGHAVELANRLVRESPHRAEVHLLVAWIMADMSRSGPWEPTVLRANVQAAVHRARTLDGANAATHTSAGSALMRIGAPTAARECFAAALAVDPGNEQALTGLSAADAARGRTRDAARYAAMTLSLDPAHPEAPLVLGASALDRATWVNCWTAVAMPVSVLLGMLLQATEAPWAARAALLAVALALPLWFLSAVLLPPGPARRHLGSLPGVTAWRAALALTPATLVPAWFLPPPWGLLCPLLLLAAYLAQVRLRAPLMADLLPMEERAAR